MPTTGVIPDGKGFQRPVGVEQHGHRAHRLDAQRRFDATDRSSLALIDNDPQVEARTEG